MLDLHMFAAMFISYLLGCGYGIQASQQHRYRMWLEVDDPESPHADPQKRRSYLAQIKHLEIVKTALLLIFLSLGSSRLILVWVNMLDNQTMQEGGGGLGFVLRTGAYFFFVNAVTFWIGYNQKKPFIEYTGRDSIARMDGDNT